MNENKYATWFVQRKDVIFDYLKCNFEGKTVKSTIQNQTQIMLSRCSSSGMPQIQADFFY